MPAKQLLIALVLALLHIDVRWLRRNAICNDLEFTEAWLLDGGNIKMRGYDVIRRHPHAAVIVGTAIENVAAFEIGDAHQGIIGGRLNVVAICSALGHAVEPQAGDFVRGSAIDDEWAVPNNRRPFLTVAWSRCVDLDVVGEIG